MLTDPSLDIQGAIVAALKADVALAALVNARVYDQAPAPVPPATTVTFPYVTVGDGSMIPELGEQTDASDTTTQVDAWSRAPGYPEVKRIAKAIIAALHDADLNVANHQNVSILVQTVNYFRDPDGLTRHAAITFQIQTDAN